MPNIYVTSTLADGHRVRCGAEEQHYKSIEEARENSPAFQEAWRIFVKAWQAIKTGQAHQLEAKLLTPDCKVVSSIFSDTGKSYKLTLFARHDPNGGTIPQAVQISTDGAVTYMDIYFSHPKILGNIEASLITFFERNECPKG